MTNIKPGDRFRRPGTTHRNIRYGRAPVYKPTVERPTRIYTVLEPWGIDWKCSLDPPLVDGSKVRVIAASWLERLEKL